MMTTPCPVKGCSKKRQDGYLMCASCWGKVPFDLRQRIWRPATPQDRLEAMREAKAFVAARLAQRFTPSKGGHRHGS